MIDDDAFAPNEYPEFVPNDPNKPHPVECKWAAAPMEGTNHFAVVIVDSIKMRPDGKGEGLTVALCPDPQIAQYLAYMHNLVLKGNELFGATADEILKAYSTNAPPPMRRRAQSPAPQETGGYL